MLWIPGPTRVRPEILAECARPMIGHRSGEMAELVARTDPGLRLAFGVDEARGSQVGVHTSSATGMMEAALHAVGGRVLCVVAGAFARRWHQVALSMGKDAVALEVPWGEAVSARELEAALREQGPFEAVTAVVNETSTGVLTPLDRLSSVLAGHPETMLFVDVVSYIAGGPVDFDAHGLDFAFAGVQKALALPPGIAVLCASERFLERARSRPTRGYYLDPVRILSGHADRKTPSTPAISLYYALARQLEDITAGATLPAADRGRQGADAWLARFEKHRRMREQTQAWAARHGLELFPSEGHASPTVSCIRAEGFDAGTLVAGLKERGFTIGNGYGELKGATFRIGHMGDHTEEDLTALLEAADGVMANLRAAP